MKKTVFIILLCAVMLLAATPLLASPPPPTGTWVNLIAGFPTTVPAGEPFFVGHGWIFDPQTTTPGHFDFQLDVDGEYQQRTRFYVQRDGALMIRFWAFEYPEGMSGTHTFTGHWIAPCAFAVDNGLYPGPCGHPNEEVEVYIADPLTVTFTP